VVIFATTIHAAGWWPSTSSGWYQATANGEPDFVLNVTSMIRWDSPHHKVAITESERVSILQGLAADLTQRGISFEPE